MHVMAMDYINGLYINVMVVTHARVHCMIRVYT